MKNATGGISKTKSEVEMSEAQPKEDCLGVQLWRLIEVPQGYAYLSDDQTEEQSDDSKVLQSAQASLRWHQECVRILKEFLRGRV